MCIEVDCLMLRQIQPGPNFMEAVTVSENSPLTIADNSVVMVSLHRLARNFGLWACALPITKDSVLQGLAQNFSACTL